jgi:hypothetical protein
MKKHRAGEPTADGGKHHRKENYEKQNTDRALHLKHDTEKQHAKFRRLGIL